MKLSDSNLLNPNFYQVPAKILAKKLLGKVLCITTPEKVFSAEILETEAYLSKDDPACHAFRGLTPRNHPMFEAGGISYVYFIYGMHYCFNVVSGKKGEGEAVLIRSVRIDGEIVKGPGCVTKRLGIGPQHNGLSLQSPLFCIRDGGLEYRRSQILTTPRIGISKAKHLLLRYVVDVL